MKLPLRLRKYTLLDFPQNSLPYGLQNYSNNRHSHSLLSLFFESIELARLKDTRNNFNSDVYDSGETRYHFSGTGNSSLINECVSKFI